MHKQSNENIPNTYEALLKHVDITMTCMHFEFGKITLYVYVYASLRVLETINDFVFSMSVISWNFYACNLNSIENMELKDAQDKHGMLTYLEQSNYLKYESESGVDEKMRIKTYVYYKSSYAFNLQYFILYCILIQWTVN